MTTRKKIVGGLLSLGILLSVGSVPVFGIDNVNSNSISNVSSGQQVYCPNVYKPTKCIIENSNGRYEVKGSNECYAKLKVKKLLKEHNIDESQVKITCYPVSSNVEGGNSQQVYCPEVYKPVVCEVIVNNGKKFKFRGSNECKARVRIRTMLRSHGLSEKDAKIDCKEVSGGDVNDNNGNESNSSNYGLVPIHMRNISINNSNMNNHIICPSVYEPTECIIKNPHGVYNVTGKNKCFAKLKVEELLRKHNIDRTKVKIDCHPINSVGEVDIGSIKKYKLIDSMSDEEIKNLFSNYLKSEVIDKLIEAKNNKEGLVRTIFFFRKDDLIVRTSNKFVADILKKNGFELIPWSHILDRKKGKINDRAILPIYKIHKIDKEKKLKFLKRIREIEKNKKKIREEIGIKDKELKKRIPAIKKKVINMIKQRKRLTPELRKEIIEIIKEKLEIKLNNLELKILEAMGKNDNETEELVNLLNALENETSSIEDEEDVYSNYLMEIESLKEEVKNVTTVKDLKLVVREYINLKQQIKSTLNSE